MQRSEHPTQVKSGLQRSQCRGDVGVAEIVAFEQQRIVHSLGERVGEAVAEVQARGVAASAAEIAISLARDPCLRLRHRCDDDLRFTDKIIEASPEGSIASGGHHDPYLKVN